MPDNLSPGVFAVVVILQLLVAVGLIVMLIRLRKAVKAQGLSMVPRDVAAKLRDLFRSSGGRGK